MISWPASEKGLGLLQVMFIMAGLTIAASVVMMSSVPQESSGGAPETYRRMDALKAATELYRAHGNGTPPSIDALLAPPTGAASCAPDNSPASPTFRQLRGWCGPYLEREAAGSDMLKRDGWRTLLQLSGTTLRSCGPNRACGDGDDITSTL